MAIEDTLNSIRDFQLSDLDFDNVGAWPMAIKFIIWILLLVAIFVGGYYLIIEDQQLELAGEEKQEVKLKKEFEKKAYQAANLEIYRELWVRLPIRPSPKLCDIPRARLARPASRSD